MGHGALLPLFWLFLCIFVVQMLLSRMKGFRIPSEDRAKPSYYRIVSLCRDHFVGFSVRNKNSPNRPLNKVLDDNAYSFDNLTRDCNAGPQGNGSNQKPIWPTASNVRNYRRSPHYDHSFYHWRILPYWIYVASGFRRFASAFIRNYLSGHNQIEENLILA